MASLSEMLVFLRKRKGLSQDELSRQIGLKRSAIGMYETGAREPSLEIMELFTKFYDVDMNTLTGKGFPDIFGNYDQNASPEKLLRFDNLLRGNAQSSDSRNELSSRELRLVSAYRNAPENIKTGVDAILDPYAKKSEKSDVSVG